MQSSPHLNIHMHRVEARLRQGFIVCQALLDAHFFDHSSPLPCYESVLQSHLKARIHFPSTFMPLRHRGIESTHGQWQEISWVRAGLLQPDCQWQVGTFKKPIASGGTSTPPRFKLIILKSNLGVPPPLKSQAPRQPVGF